MEKGLIKNLKSGRLATSLLFPFLIFITTSLFSQDQGNLPDVEIQIINPLKVTLPKADRNFSKVPAQPVEPIVPPIIYDYSLINFSTPLYNPGIRPLRIKPPEQKETKSNFLSGGFGNYTSPYARGYISLLPKKSVTVGGISFSHQSFAKGPIDGKNSRSSQSYVEANVKGAGSQLATEALIGWSGRGANFYGYDTSKVDKFKRDTLKQTYQTYYASGKISNAKKSDFNYELRPSFSYLKDRFYARESDLVFAANSNYKMKEGTLLIDAYYSITSRKDTLVEAKPRNLFYITPQLQFVPAENLILKIGLTAAYENDTIDSKNFHAYPALNASYTLNKKFNVYVGLNGGMEKVTLHTLSAENIWVNRNIPIYHTNKTADFTAGLTGDLGGGFNFSAGVSIAKLKNYYLYVNDSVERSKFNTVYDDVARSNFFAKLNFDKGNYSFRLRGDAFAYSAHTQQAAWHKPKYKIDAYVVIKAADKLSIVPRFIMMGGMKAIDYQQAPDKVVTLPTALDLSASVEYSFNEKLGAFLRFNNILSSKYSLYYHYPVRGFQVLGGLTWRF